MPSSTVQSLAQSKDTQLYRFEYKTDKDVPYWADTLTIPWPIRQLLIKYSGIPAEDVEKELLALRAGAWETFPFPCIGNFDFLGLALSLRNLLYPRLLSRLQPGGARFLDVGCCLGQDIRKLVFDGAPAENLVGLELRQGYINLGYDLFRDRSKLGAKMLQGDFVNDSLDDKEIWGRFDIVNFSMVLHVFSWEDQVRLLERGIKALKPNTSGTSIIGLACGSLDGKIEDWGGQVPAHNEESFVRLVKEVEERTGTRWEVDVELDTFFDVGDPKHAFLGPEFRRVVFELTRLP
ncbi:hypothetical protein B0H66DRAFT_616655 [Apodospora peruviana]|uniref:Methyltransferase domain-containing protein n=1 Tax=Apodospora peruviana TaxID=516989 RepID=A0AAE0MAY6_9PEZI|nr:hypothetical protein B0H66DRAFT_616655 [Apodospora peruviana]